MNLKAMLLGTLVAVMPASGLAQDTGTLVVANMSDNTATIIDLASRRTLATLPTGPAPHEVAVTSDGRWAVVTNYGRQDHAGRSVTVIDLRDLEVERTIDTGIYDWPHGVAVLPGDSLAIVTSQSLGYVVTLDIHRGEIVDTVATGGRLTHMLAMSDDGMVFTSNMRDSSVSVIDPAASRRLAVHHVAPAVEGIAANPDGRLVWVGSNADRTVTVLEAATGQVVHVFEGFGFPYRIGITPDSRTAVLADPARGEIRIVDVATMTERHRVQVPPVGVKQSTEFAGSAAPEGIAMAVDGRTAYVSLQGRDQVAAVDLASGTIRWTMDTGAWPDGIAYSTLTR